MIPDVTILHDRGGLGDWVCLSAVIGAVQDSGRAVRVVGPDWARDVLREAWIDCEFVPVPFRRPLRPCGLGDLAAVVGDGPVIDLNGPEWRHEWNARGAVTRDRVALWAEAAGVQPVRPAMPVYERTGRGPVIMHNKSKSILRNVPTTAWARIVAEVQRHGPARVICTDMPFADLCDLVREAAGCIAVDSGILHLAAAYGVPTVGLFGATSATVTQRIYMCDVPDRAWLQPAPVRFYQAIGGHPCQSPCYGYSERGMYGGRCLSGCADMEAFDPDTVWNSLEEIL